MLGHVKSILVPQTGIYYWVLTFSLNFQRNGMLELLICVNKLKSCLKESMVSLKLSNSCDILFLSFLTLDCSFNMSKSHSTSVMPSFFNLSLRRPWIVSVQILEVLFLDYSKALQEFPLFNCQLIFLLTFSLHIWEFVYIYLL